MSAIPFSGFSSVASQLAIYVENWEEPSRTCSDPTDFQVILFNHWILIELFSLIFFPHDFGDHVSQIELWDQSSLPIQHSSGTFQLCLNSSLLQASWFLCHIMLRFPTVFTIPMKLDVAGIPSEEQVLNFLIRSGVLLFFPGQRPCALNSCLEQLQFFSSPDYHIGVSCSFWVRNKKWRDCQFGKENEDLCCPSQYLLVSSRRKE